MIVLMFGKPSMCMCFLDIVLETVAKAGLWPIIFSDMQGGIGCNDKHSHQTSTSTHNLHFYLFLELNSSLHIFSG